MCPTSSQGGETEPHASPQRKNQPRLASARGRRLETVITRDRFPLLSMNIRSVCIHSRFRDSSHPFSSNLVPPSVPHLGMTCHQIFVNCSLSPSPPPPRAYTIDLLNLAFHPRGTFFCASQIAAHNIHTALRSRVLSARRNKNAFTLPVRTLRLFYYRTRTLEFNGTPAFSERTLSLEKIR